ncbi:MAG: hypothetical protein ACRDRH_21220 [Pseudonocardia sp.]
MDTRPPPTAATATEPSRAERAHTVLIAILGTAFLVSIVHYTDNYLGYEHYPQLESGPNPSASVILSAWFVFVACGVVVLAFTVWLGVQSPEHSLARR